MLGTCSIKCVPGSGHFVIAQRQSFIGCRCVFFQPPNHPSKVPLNCPPAPNEKAQEIPSLSHIL